MLSRLSLTTKRAAMVVAAVLVTSGCGMMAPKTERYVAPTVGTTYSNLRRDSGSYGSATVQLPGKYLGERSWRGQMVHAFESPEGTSLGTTGDRFAFIAQVRGDTPIVTWEPPVGYQLPVEIGKSWTRKYKLTMHATNQSFQVEDTQTVEAYEDVTTPAGTFKAWRVRTVDNLGNDNVQWYSPEAGLFVKQTFRRTDKHASGPGTREMELVSYQRP